ncbi:hypothetical protein KP509_01G069200 [Ceratopteris richardii]|nr:hypothetical protein KP509_01G069200 [Ceratopteris richardii]
MRRTSLLEVLDEALPDKQANAVRRQGIDSSMLRYAGLILSQDTQTGVVYSVALPPSLQGIRAQAVRVVQDAFKQAGFILNEFTFPANAVLSPESEYVMLVYRETSSFTIYTLPPDYQFGGPVVGIVMSSSNSTSIDPSVPPATISLPADSYINVSLPTFSTISGSNALCAFFSSNGSVFTSNIASQPNFCLSSTLGDFAIIIKGHPGSSPMQDASPSTPSTDGNLRSSPSKKNSSTNWRLIVGAIFLTFAGLVFLVAVAFLSIKLTESARILLKTRYNGNDEALQDSLVGGGHAPSAPIIRTKPALEIDVARFSHHLDV